MTTNSNLSIRFLHFLIVSNLILKRLSILSAVVWTDAIQYVLMMGAILSVMFLGNKSVGGWSNTVAAAERGQRIEFFKFVYILNFSILLYLYLYVRKKKSKREENHVETNWHDKFHSLKGIFSVLFATQNNITDNNKKIRSILLKHWCGAKNCLLYFHTQFRSKSICSDNILEHINWHDSSFIGKHWHQSSYSATMFIFIGSIKG